MIIISINIVKYLKDIIQNKSICQNEDMNYRSKSVTKIILLFDCQTNMKNKSQQIAQVPVKQNIQNLPTRKISMKGGIDKQNGHNLVQIQRKWPSAQKQIRRNQPQRNNEKGNSQRGKSTGRIWKQQKREVFVQVKIENKNQKAEHRQQQERKPSKSVHQKQGSCQTNKNKAVAPVPSKPPLPNKQMGETQKNRIRNMKVTVENSDKVKQDGTIPIKLVLVGDGSVGKTCMLISYTTDNFPTDYVPTIFDNYVADIKYGKHMVKLWLWDTAGQQQYAELRLISYQKADVFFICFSMIDQNSLNNALNKWLPEVHEECPKAIKILVGTKSDLHSQYLLDPAHVHKAIPIQYIHKKCEGKKCFFMPCSGLDQKGLNDVFNKAIGMIIDRVQKRKKQESSLCQVI